MSNIEAIVKRMIVINALYTVISLCKIYLFSYVYKATVNNNLKGIKTFLISLAITLIFQEIVNCYYYYIYDEMR